MTAPKTPAATDGTPVRRSRAALVTPGGSASPSPPTGEADGKTSPPAAPAPGGMAGTPDTCITASRARKSPAAGTPKAPGRGIGASPVSLSGLHAAAMTEVELEEQVRDACKKLGVLRIHIYHARGTTPGVPDDILIGPRGVLWRELKTMTGHVSPAQRAMGEALLAAGQDWALWRPVDWFSGRIKSELTAISGLRVATA